MGLDGPSRTLIDVTLAAHNIHQPGPDYTVGLAANNSALVLDLTPNLSSSHSRHLVPSIQKLARSSAITSLLVQHTTQAWRSETL